jgi:hypothetical protein
MPSFKRHLRQREQRVATGEPAPHEHHGGAGRGGQQDQAGDVAVELVGRQQRRKQVADEQPAQEGHRKRLDQPVHEQRDADAAHVLAHLVQAPKSTLTSIGMIITQISRPTGRLTLATSMPPMAWNTPGKQLAKCDAGDDAQEHPDGEVALEHAHRRVRGLFGCDFTLNAHAATPPRPRARLPAAAPRRSGGRGGWPRPRSRAFVARALAQQGRGDAGGGHAVVDDPGPGLDAGAAQVGLQVGGFQHRRGFGQRDEQHLGLLRVLQLHHRRGEVHAGAAHLAHDVAVVGAGGVEQQQGVAGGRGVHHHELPARLADDAREGLEHGDLLGAGRAQVFFQHGAARRHRAAAPLVASTWGGSASVTSCGSMRLTVRCSSVPSSVSARCAAGSEVVRCTGRPRRRQFHRHRRGQRGLAHAALAHQHDQAVAIGGDVVHQRGKAGRDQRGLGRKIGAALMGAESPSRWRRASRPTRLKALSGSGRWAAGSARRAWRPGPPARARRSRRPAGRLRPRRPGNTPLTTRYCFDRPMAASSVWVRAASRSVGLCARATSTSRVRGVGQGIDGGLVLAALLLQPGQRPQAGGVALARLPESRSRRRATAAGGWCGRWARCRNMMWS